MRGPWGQRQHLNVTLGYARTRNKRFEGCGKNVSRLLLASNMIFLPENPKASTEEVFKLSFLKCREGRCFKHK